MRVLHVIEATLGGTLRYVENIAAATGDTDLVLGLAYGTSRADSRLAPLLATVRERGWTTYSVDMGRAIEPRRDLAALFALGRAMRDFQPDIVHCHSSKGGALGRAAAWLQRRRIVRLYTPNALAAPLGGHYLAIEKVLSRFTDGFIAVSESEKREIEGFGLDRGNHTYVVDPLVDTTCFASGDRAKARAAIGLAERPTVLGIGRLMVQKDPGSFVTILSRLRDTMPGVQALWLGAGEGEAAFLKQVRDAGLVDVIQLVPWQHDVRPYIAAANVLLSTSLFESFGYMVAEALAMGVPAVATNVTGTCDIMRGELAAWLYPVRDHGAAAALLARMLSDPTAADALGLRAREHVASFFSREQMRRGLLETYAEALARVRIGKGRETGHGRAKRRMP